MLTPPTDDLDQFHRAILMSVDHPVPAKAHHNPAKEWATNLLG